MDRFAAPPHTDADFRGEPGVALDEQYDVEVPVRVAHATPEPPARVERSAGRGYAPVWSQRHTAQTRATRTRGCWKCGGSGYISAYAHVQGGQCFACR